MKSEPQLTRYVRRAILALGLALPTLTLIPLGSLWLWQHGYLIYWALGVCFLTTCAFLAQRWILGPPVGSRYRRPEQEVLTAPAAELTTPAERAAWTEVERLAAEVEPDALGSRDAVLALGTRIVEAVARAMHPELRDPLWQFTVTEALTLAERVSGRMRIAIHENVPLGDKLTVAQLMRLWRWRKAIDVAERAYDLWRLVRLLNPMTAATHEIREQLQKRMYNWGKEHLARRVAETYVREVGRAAIELYSGRLILTAEQIGRHRTRVAERDREALGGPEAEPLRVLVAGQIGAGKSSLINALADEVKAAVDVLPATAGFTPYELEREEMPAAVIVDSPGLTSGREALDSVIAQAQDSDLLIWVAAASRADREIDRTAMHAFREHFAARHNRRRPPLILVLTHIDRLRPFREWVPPYDVAEPASEKAASIRAAMEAYAAELEFALADVVPVCLESAQARYNVDAVWAKILAALPEAQRAQLVRCLRDIEARWDWGHVWSQAANAGRVIARTLVR